MNKCNGWTNYATWRVNVEILGDIEFNEHVSADYLKEIVEDCVFSNTPENLYLIKDYALAFLGDVNYFEIAEHINEEIDLQIKNEH